MPHYKKTITGIRISHMSNSTRGKDKGENCTASAQDRVFCKRNRSYKYPGYVQWLERTRTN